MRPKSASLFEADPPKPRRSVDAPIEPEPKEVARSTEGAKRYRVRAVECVLLDPSGRCIGFGSRDELSQTAARLGEVVHE